MDTLNHTFDTRLFPGLFTWKKDLDFVFVDISPCFSEALGFKTSFDALGRRDEEIPCAYAESAENFRKSDQMVLDKNAAVQFIEIQSFANKEWKILSVVKTPWYEEEKIQGTSGYCIDITQAFLCVNEALLAPLLHDKKKGEQSQFILNSKNNLSQRESETLFFILRGDSCKKIGERLHLSKRTVEQYLDNLKFKFNVNNKADLIDFAMRAGYFNQIPKSLLSTPLILEVQS